MIQGHCLDPVSEHCEGIGSSSLRDLSLWRYARHRGSTTRAIRDGLVVGEEVARLWPHDGWEGGRIVGISKGEESEEADAEIARERAGGSSRTQFQKSDIVFVDGMANEGEEKDDDGQSSVWHRDV